MAKDTTTTERKPKQRIEPRVKAQAALDVVNRKIAVLDKREADLTAQLAAVVQERGPLYAQQTYLAANPLLASGTTGPAEPDSSEL